MEVLSPARREARSRHEECSTGCDDGHGAGAEDLSARAQKYFDRGIDSLNEVSELLLDWKGLFTKPEAFLEELHILNR